MGPNKSCAGQVTAADDVPQPYKSPAVVLGEAVDKQQSRRWAHCLSGTGHGYLGLAVLRFAPDADSLHIFHLAVKPGEIPKALRLFLTERKALCLGFKQ